MSSEISLRHSATGETLYFTIRNTSRQMWNTGGTPNFETLVVANWTSYAVAMSESPASSYFFAGTFPAISGNMVAGWYWVDIFKRAGGSAAISDVLQASYFGYWDGTTFRFWADDATHVNGMLQTPADVAGLLGALNASASSGDPGTTTTLVQYLKQIINTLEGSAGIPTFPAAAAPANAVSLAEAIRSIYTQLGVAGAGLTAVGDTRLANLDAAVSTRLAAASYSAPLDAAGTRTAVGLAAANLDSQLSGINSKTTNIPASPATEANVSAVGSAVLALGSPLQASSYTTPPTVAQIDTQLSGTHGAGSWLTGSSSASGPTAAEIADAVWDEAIAGHLTSGSTGAKLNTAAAGGGGGSTTVALAIPKATVQAVLESGQIGCVSATTLRIAFAGDNVLGDISSRTDLVFTAKQSLNDADSAAIIQITENTGLTRLNGSAATAADGDIVVTDEDIGEVTIILYAEATAELDKARGLTWDVKAMYGASPADAVELTRGTLNVDPAVTRAVP